MKEYEQQINLKGETDKASRILSAILHGLREIISTEESFQLLAQLPMFLKAVYVNGWSGRKKRKIKNLTEFIDLVWLLNQPTSLNDFESDEVLENYMKTTFIVLRKYISLGELEDIRTELPKDIKNIVYQNIMF